MLAVPATLIPASNAGSATERRTSIWAARWKISSGVRCSASSAIFDPSRTSASLSSAPPLSAPSRVSRRPVERSSITVTSSPRASSASTRLEPMNPAPPVTRDRIRRAFSRSARAPSFKAAALGLSSRLLPSPTRTRVGLHATDSHREEQQRREDRRDPRRQPQGRQELQGPLLYLVRRGRRAHGDRAQGPCPEPGLPRGLLQLAADR